MSGNGPFVAALLDPGQPPPVGLRAWNGSDPTLRFNVYRNNVIVSLIEALATTFPVTRELVGAQFFQAIARLYTRQSPPVSGVLFEYGVEFPDFVAGFAPAGDLPYLSDVARLEYSRVQSFHAADSGALGADAFSGLLESPDRLMDLRVRLHPACRIVRSSHAVVSIWAAHQGQLALEDVALDQPEDALVCRPAYDVQVLALPPGGADFLGALARGCSFGEAAAIGGNEAGFDLAANLHGLIGHALVAGLD